LHRVDRGDDGEHGRDEALAGAFTVDAQAKTGPITMATWRP